MDKLSEMVTKLVLPLPCCCCAEGMVEEGEADKLSEMVTTRLGRVERAGPRWQQPTVSEVLANTHMFQGVDTAIAEWVRVHGRLKVGGRVWAEVRVCHPGWKARRLTVTPKHQNAMHACTP